MSETPETDAELNLYFRHGEAHQISVTWVEFARKLERERDELAALLAAEKATRNSIIEKGVKTERERDEARKSLDEMSKYLAQATAQQDHAETELRKWMAFAKNVLGERNEAKKRLKEIEEYGTEEINAAIDLRRNLAQALVDLDDMQYQRDEASQQLRIAVGLLSTQPQFADKHPEDVLDFVKESAK